MVIGAAGENLVTYACVMTGIKNSGGRTGMGCVMGSKNLKAISCRGDMDIKLAHPVDALEHNKRHSSNRSPAPRSIRRKGPWGPPSSGGRPTAGAVSAPGTSSTTRCFTPMKSSPKPSTTSPRKPWAPITWRAASAARYTARAKYKDPDRGPLAGKYDEGPEYTSLGAFGSEPDCRKAETVLSANHLVDQYGVDNLEIGSIISWAMELYELGIITNKETEGLELKFGNDSGPDPDDPRDLQPQQLAGQCSG